MKGQQICNRFGFLHCDLLKQGGSGRQEFGTGTSAGGGQSLPSQEFIRLQLISYLSDKLSEYGQFFVSNYPARIAIQEQKTC